MDKIEHWFTKFFAPTVKYIGLILVVLLLGYILFLYISEWAILIIAAPFLYYFFAKENRFNRKMNKLVNEIPAEELEKIYEGGKINHLFLDQQISKILSLLKKEGIECPGGDKCESEINSTHGKISSAINTRYLYTRNN
ncbi:MAG: hypothetical protein WC080_04685 [Patescibacteria group bacterium]|jgi:hypothetical protein